MTPDSREQAIKQQEFLLDDPLFYDKVFSFVSKERRQQFVKEPDNFKRVIVEEYDELSIRLDRTKIQESCSVRNVLRTRRLANLLINDKGELNLAVLPKVIGFVEEYLYSLGPQRQFDAKRQLHLLSVLNQLNENKEIVRLLKSIDKPVSHKIADQVIRDTLNLPANTSITDAHARRAALSAWMCMLRQNVGSCFATAPGIIIQSEQPETFLKDLIELLNTGRLKRTFGGVEYVVPLSLTSGAGDLRRPFYLPTNDLIEESSLWYSPGLEAAFEACGLLGEDDNDTARVERIKKLVIGAVRSISANQPFVITNCEDIIRAVLLKEIGITEKDLADYENRPTAMIHSGLLMSGPTSGGGGKGQLCATFKTKFEIACAAFRNLADNALLKAWEFSMASFAETKSQFARWNLYSSLGLEANQRGGIGACLYEVVNRKLQEANHRVQEFQEEYENLYHQLKTMETRMRSVSSEKDAAWLRAEYQTKRNEFYTFEELRDKLHSKARKLAELYNVMVEVYDQLFPKYFQEVYDADMHDVNTGPYDDSPAGFRLLYKYGRSNTSQWTLIHTPNEFIEDLVSFFTATENEVRADKAVVGLDEEITEITTAIVSHLRTKEFLETALWRMASAHNAPMLKDPLEHLDKIEKKPWAYTSGGTMGSLVTCYYKLSGPPAEASRWVESPTELLVFLIDTLKQIPPRIMDDFNKSGKKFMLMHSPTHAFLLKPSEKVFKCAWENNLLTYTWVRDHLILPRKKMLNQITLDGSMMQHLVEKLTPKVHENLRHYFSKTFGSIYGDKSPSEFRNHLMSGIKKDRGLRQGGQPALSEEEIDSVLYTALPLFPRSELREKIEQIYGALPMLDQKVKESAMALYDTLAERYTQLRVIDAAQLQNIAKALLCLAIGATSSTIDYHSEVAAAAQKLKFALPHPIVFADTNWVKDEFCFVVNPGTEQLELWRGDPIGRNGSPMAAWEQWLDGSRKDIPWGVYTKPYEYQ